MRTLSIYLVFGAVFLAICATAAPKKAKQSNIRNTLEQLNSPDPEAVMATIQALAASGSKEATEPLISLLRKGPRNDITNAIIQALGAIGDPNAIDTLLEYLSHRRPDARMLAIYALEDFEDPRIVRAFETALRDSDSQVRSTAALALGKRGRIDSVPILFKAFERGVSDAVISIGQLGTPEHARRLAGYLGEADIGVLLPGFDEFLRREDFPKADKLDILTQLFELAGPDVKRFAKAYKASFPEGTKEENDELYKMVSRMVRQIQEE
ncbi:MAG: HEAT repeat domain-containing protein [Myxococcota bacterium]|nr:HEAT repeat domain-containing protein [Myxococcota bacterium]